MDIKSLLAKEHSKEITLQIVDWIGEDKERFAIFMEVFLKESYRIVQRAAWALGIVGQKHPELLYPYFNEFVGLLQKLEVHDAVKRNILRTLQEMQIPEEYEGELAQICFELLHSNEAIAIKAFAMKTVYHICQKYPELMPELKQILEERIPFESKGFQNRGKKILEGKKI